MINLVCFISLVLVCNSLFFVYHDQSGLFGLDLLVILHFVFS